jgi:uncharacterized protein YidB (DUF937 family)
VSVLEDVLGSVVTKALGGGSDKEKLVKTLLPVVIALLANGGLKKIIDAMNKQGMEKQANSWVGDGENLPITPDQATKVVGESQIKDISEKIGLPEDETAKLVAEALPQVVDKASPEGKEPEDAEVDKTLESLKG